MQTVRKEDIPQLSPQGSWKKMPADPLELFILSKVDGKTPVEELAILCARPIDETSTVVSRLFQNGILQLPRHHEPATPVSAQQTRDFAISEAYLLPLQEADQKLMAEECALSAVRKEEILRVYSSINQLNPFQIFGLDAEASDKEVKRAYQKLTLKYHPDRFYGKEIGGFKPLIEKIFKVVSDNYDLISDQMSRDNMETVYSEWLASQKTKMAAPEAAPVTRHHDGAESLTAEQRQRRRSSIRKRLREITQEIPQFTREDLEAGAGTALDPTELLERKKRHRRKFAPLGAKDRITKARQHLEEGKKAIADEAWPTAASHLNMALSLDPKNEEIRQLQATAEINANEIMSVNYSKKAKMEGDLGNWSKAAKLYALAADISHSFEHAISAAKAFSKCDEHAKAKEYAILAQTWNQDSPRGPLTLAHVYLNAGLMNRARTVLNDILTKWPGNKDANLMLKKVK